MRELKKNRKPNLSSQFTCVSRKRYTSRPLRVNVISDSPPYVSSFSLSQAVISDSRKLRDGCCCATEQRRKVSRAGPVCVCARGWYTHTNTHTLFRSPLELQSAYTEPKQCPLYMDLWYRGAQRTFCFSPPPNHQSVFTKHSRTIERRASVETEIENLTNE